MKKLITGINGFGRFGIHLLKYWLEREKNSNFTIDYINDENLNIDQILGIISNDKYCKFHKLKFFNEKNTIKIKLPYGKEYVIEFTNSKDNNITWLSKVDYLLECSGKNTDKKSYKKFLINKKIKILISATSWDCDQTIIYGFNHSKIKNKSRVLSYGSCTVNAYVPLADCLNKIFKILDSDVNVIHNIQNYKLKNYNTLTRKFCTLEKSGLNLLNFLNSKNFKVNYTIIPYDGVSIMDFRFSFKQKISYELFLKTLKKEIKNGSLQNMYNTVKIDTGPEVQKFTENSAVIIESSIEVKNNHIYFMSYLDNENSVNRYYDLINFISK